MTGISLRRYVTRLRTSMAAQRLANGERDLTELALDLGFSDHSHFTNTFRKECGISPSRFRARFVAQRRCEEKMNDEDGKAQETRASRMAPCFYIDS